MGTHRPGVMSAGFPISFFALLLFFGPKTQAASFKTLNHGVKGEVKVEGHTIVVENFSYDGTAPDAFFYVGTSGCPSGAGTRIGDKQLERHNNQQRMELVLPNSVRAGDVTWVSVWCRKFDVDFGHAFLSHTEEENCTNGSSGAESSGNGKSGNGTSGSGTSGSGLSGNGTSGSESSKTGSLAILVTMVSLGVH